MILRKSFLYADLLFKKHIIIINVENRCAAAYFWWNLFFDE